MTEGRPLGAAFAHRVPAPSVLGDLDPSLAHGVDDGLGPVVDRQLAEDRAHVVLDRLLADRQRVGDLLVRHALGDVVEDLDLARGERREDGRGLLAVHRQLAELLEDTRRDRRLREDLVVDQVLAADDATDDRDEVVGTDVLEDERGGAGLDRVEERVLVLADREDDDPRRGQLALDPLGRLDSARSRQREVHEDDVGRGLERPVDGRSAGVGLADHVEVGLAAQDVGDADAEQRMVVDDQDLGPLAVGVPAVRPAPPPLWSCIAHQGVSSAPSGIASRTTVPALGRDCTSKRAPISSARSCMNWRPKLRRPRAATAPTSNPRPSSRTVSTQSSPSIALATMTDEAPPCLRTFCSASCTIRSTTVCWVSFSRADGAFSSVAIARPLRAVTRATASEIAPSRPSSSRTAGRSWLMNVRTLPSSRRSSSRRNRSSVRARRSSLSMTRSMYP